MILMILWLLSLIPTTLRLRSDLALESLALCQPLAVLNRRCRRPKLRKLDRFFWDLLSQCWEHWKETLVIINHETVHLWHRRRFACYWTRLSGHDGPGRPGKNREIRELIRKIAKSNPFYVELAFMLIRGPQAWIFRTGRSQFTSHEFPVECVCFRESRGVGEWQLESGRTRTLMAIRAIWRALGPVPVARPQETVIHYAHCHSKKARLGDHTMRRLTTGHRWKVM